MGKLLLLRSLLVAKNNYHFLLLIFVIYDIILVTNKDMIYNIHFIE